MDKQEKHKHITKTQGKSRCERCAGARRAWHCYRDHRRRKGQTTSGFGTVTRCVGHGFKAAVVQFIKGTWDCGERTLLEQQGVPLR